MQASFCQNFFSRLSVCASENRWCPIIDCLLYVCTCWWYFLVLICSGSPKSKNTLSTSNSVMYDESHKTTVPHQTTDTGELYAMSAKAVDKDAHNDPSLLYAYAMVDTQRVRKLLFDQWARLVT